MADFDFQDHGSICLLTPVSEVASQWCDEHLPEDAMRWHQFSYVIEPRYVQNILDGIAEEGMTVS